MKKHEIPKEILITVEDELLTGERLLWVGQPKPLRMLSLQSDRPPTVALGIAVASLFAGLVAFFIAGGTNGMEPPLIIGGIVAILILIVALALSSQYQTAQNMIYAITNRRAFIINRNTVQSFGSSELQSLERRMHRDGLGDVIFRIESGTHAAAMKNSSGEQLIGFLGIENPQSVEALLLETFHADSQSNKRLQSATDDEYYADEDAIGYQQRS